MNILLKAFCIFLNKFLKIINKVVFDDFLFFLIFFNTFGGHNLLSINELQAQL
jgi:hypothetical protein